VLSRNGVTLNPTDWLVHKLFAICLAGAMHTLSVFVTTIKYLYLKYIFGYTARTQCETYS